MRRRTVVGAAVALALVVAGAVVWTQVPRGPGAGWVTREGDELRLDGEPFVVAGTNNYRPMFLDAAVVDQMMKAAADNDLTVLRAWAFNDIGDPQDPTTTIDPQNATTYFQYWDTEAGAPAVNEGENGLERLDHVVASAKQHGIRLVLPFVNNWGSFGGMDQYVQWAGAEYHSDFYTDPQIRQWYKDWVRHLLERENTITGVKYKDEPTIMAWELANEARCLSSGKYEPAPDCTAATLTEWTQEMATFVKSVDDKHLLGFGGEGFWCDEDGDHFAYDCSQGTDSRAIAHIEEIDLVGLHVYPDHWGTTVDWSQDFIERHVALAAEVDKPVFVGELGWRGAAPRSKVFEQWLRAFFDQGGDVALYWIMQPRDEYTTPPDSDGFTAYCPSAVCTQVGQWTRAMAGETDLPPVAEVDVLVTTVDVSGEVDLLENDVSVLSDLDRAVVDLDPGADGVQAELTTDAGVLRVVDGVLTLEPAAGWTGRTEVTYTVADVDGRVGEPARVTVRVGAASDG